MMTVRVVVVKGVGRRRPPSGIFFFFFIFCFFRGQFIFERQRPRRLYQGLIAERYPDAPAPAPAAAKPPNKPIRRLVAWLNHPFDFFFKKKKKKRDSFFLFSRGCGLYLRAFFAFSREGVVCIFARQALIKPRNHLRAPGGFDKTISLHSDERAFTPKASHSC